MEIDKSVTGVLVQRVGSFSAAAEGGLEAGDIVSEVNKVPVNSVAEALKERKGFKGNVLMLRVYSAAREQSNSVIVRLK